MTLWLPWIDYSKSYVGVAQQFAAQLPQQYRCVDTNVGAAQRASFAYFGTVRFAPAGYHDCDYLIFQDNNQLGENTVMRRFPGNWTLLLSGRRPADRDERFRLYRRTATTTASGAELAVSPGHSHRTADRAIP
jgi:hypothetical protein